MMKESQCRVAICVATYRRPAMLAQLIDGIGQLRLVKTRPDISLIVVDNDPAGSARAAVAARGGRFPFPVSYFIEPSKGYSQARNRALREASPHTDFIAFIDDDEVPGENWLEDLLLTQARFHAGMVSGPVVPVLPLNARNWIVKGRFFERSHRKTGDILDAAAAGNLLISRGVLQSVPSFDERFGGSGAEDTDFTMRARRAGHSIVWCEEAVVAETVEANRLNVRWLCNRTFVTGRNFYQIELENSSTPLARLRILSKAIGRGLEGLLSIATSPFAGFHRAVAGLRSLTRAAGIVSALIQAPG